MNSFIKVLILSLFLGLCLGQSIAIYDTVQVEIGQSEIQLSHVPVLASSVQLFHDGQWFTTFTLDPIEGIVTIPDSLSGRFIIYYKYLDIPISVGPYYTFLPLLSLDSLSDNSSILTRRKTIKRNPQTLVSSGSIFRNMGISPLGGNSFSGGLQFQIQGQLGDDMLLNGILTDRDIPIQPEGNTQSLEEIDKVFIQITHPKFSIEAGDIDLSYKSGKYLNINRKLTGLKYNYTSERWKSKAVLAGSDGEFNILEMKGEDGRQGPYFLTSKTGNRDVIVLAGTEKVYLDGNLLSRGENNDYIIDYSRGELTINPKHIIHADSDIYLEYQYSDFNYSRNVLGSQVSYHKPTLDVSIAWLREKDVFSPSQQQISSTVVEALKAAGDSLISIQSGVLNSDGKYVLDNGIYIYWELDPNTSLDRYTVTFQFDGLNGSYTKKISPTGKLYFEYMEPENRNSTMDLYSPGRKLIAPKTEELFQVQGKARISNKLTIDSEFGLSNYDLNHISSKDDADNIGFGYRSIFSGDKIPFIKNVTWDYSLSIWGRTEEFHAMSRERDAGFASTWNTASGLSHQNEQLVDGHLVLHNQQDRLEIGRSTYAIGKKKKDRLFSNVFATKNWFPEISADFNKVVEGKSTFDKMNSKIVVLPGKFHPFVEMKYQHDHDISKYIWNTLGLEYLGKEVESAIKVGQRTDFAQIDTSTTQLDTLSVGIFGEIDFARKVRSGWSGSAQLRKRIVEHYTNNDASMDFNMAQISARFNKANNPLRLDVQIRSEQTFSEKRALVYDSVGVGLGQYRYDRAYNEYIPDANGAFIAYTAYTGDRQPVTRLESLSRIRLNGLQQPIKWLKPLQSLTEIKLKFDGDVISFASPVFHSGVSEKDISREFWQLRQEFTYRPIHSNRFVRYRHRQKRDLLGSDPRGNDLKRDRMNEIEWQEPLQKDWRWNQKGEIHSYRTTSTVSTSRNRLIEGWWTEGGPQWSGSKDWQIKLLMKYGMDGGMHSTKAFDVIYLGSNVEVIRFYKSTSRLQINMEYVSTKSPEDVSTIPPEANQGLPLGESLKVSGLAEIRIGKHLSLLSTLNYIDNQRYDKFIAFNGELRAYF